MYPVKINNNLWILGNDYFHIYLIRGTKASVLVETGISATADTVLGHLSSLNIKPDFIIVTHPHSDHITGLDYLKKAFSEMTVITGDGAESFIAHPKSAQSLIAEDIHMLEAMRARGLCKSSKAISSPPSLAGCRVVRDAEELGLGDIKIRFLEVKGHAPGNILVHLEDMKTVLVSDSLGNLYPGRGFYPTFFTGYGDYMATIDRLEKLGMRNLGLAHSGFFTEPNDIKKIFQKARQCADDLHKYIFRSKKNDEEIAEDLFRFYYVDELTIYSESNILNCCRLLIKRVRELNVNGRPS